jgi:hypothetical protein
LFPIPKEKLEWTQLADEDEFLNLCKRFWGVSIGTNWIWDFRLKYGGFKKQVKVMEATSDDKQVLHITVLCIFMKPGWGMYFPIGR